MSQAQTAAITPELVRLETQGAVVTLTLARSEMHNALVPELLEALLQRLESIHKDASIRVVVLAAEGPAFSIGGDMRRFLAEGRLGNSNLLNYSARLVGLLNTAVQAMIQLPQPVIGAIHGAVTGGSIGFVAAADILVFADDAVLKAHYVNAGFCPDGGWTAYLADQVGSRRVAAALMLNRSITAAQALEWGLAIELAPAPDVLSKALALAVRLASFPAGTVQYSKRLLAGDPLQLAARLESERQGFLALVTKDEALQGVEQFLSRFTSYPGTPA